MLAYFVRLLQYVKTIEPNLDARRLLKDIGMHFEQVEKVMEEYDYANILIQKF